MTSDTEKDKAKSSDYNDINFKELIFKINYWRKFLLSKWLWIIGFSILGATIGFTYSKLKKPVYIAASVFVLEDGTTNGLSQYAGIASMVGLDVGSGGGGLFQGDNVIELYKSRTMIQKTLLTPVNFRGQKRLLVDQYIWFKKLREQWKEKPELRNIKFDAKPGIPLTRLQDSLLGKFIEDVNANMLSVAKPDKKLSIIRVEVRSNDEFFSKEFNDNMVKDVNEFFIQTKTKKALENYHILQHQVDSIKRVLNGNIISSASTVDATPNLNPTRQLLRVPVQRYQINAETNKAIFGELLKNLELSKIALRKEAPLIQIVDVPQYPLYKEQPGKLKGIIIGGILFGILTLVIIFLRQLLRLMLE